MDEEPQRLHYEKPQITPEMGSILHNLAQPFPMEMLRARVGAVFNKDSADPTGMPLFYAEWWTAYLPRLEQEIGPEGPHTWTIEPITWGTKLITRMSAFGGILTGFCSGESDDNDPNLGTSAEAQAKKRVCAQVVKLGRYLYQSPRLYGRVEKRGNSFAFIEGEERHMIERYYRAAGYHPFAIGGIAVPVAPPSSPPASLPVPATRTTPRQLAPARAATHRAEQRVTKGVATNRQKLAITSLVRRVTEKEGENACNEPNMASLTNQEASLLIVNLQRRAASYRTGGTA